MQPLQPSASPQPDPLFPARDPSGLSKTPGRPAGSPSSLREAAPRRTDPIRLVPSIKLYHRMRPGKLYPLTVELRGERDLSHGAGHDAGLVVSGPTVSVQPVIPGAVVSPAAADVPATTGGTASFSICTAGRKAMRHKDARVEFRSGGRLLLTVRTPARTVTRRAAWFFVFLAIALLSLFALIRAFPFPSTGGELVAPRQAGALPGPGVRGAGAVPAVPGGVDKKDAPDDKKGNSPEKGTSPTSEEKKPGTSDKTSGEGTPSRPGSGQPGGGPGGARPQRAGGGSAAGMMSVQVDPETLAQVRKPLDARDKLDRYITMAAGQVYGKEQESHLAPPTHQSAPKDLREVMYKGLYYIKDGWQISETRKIPGLLDAYECIFERTLWDYQDWVIGGLLLIVAALLWSIQSASSRRVQGGVLEILPA